jgi:hypothetical protein
VAPDLGRLPEVTVALAARADEQLAHILAIYLSRVHRPDGGRVPK